MKEKLMTFSPIIFLVFTLSFMTLFGHEDTLSDSEKFRYKSLLNSKVIESEIMKEQINYRVVDAGENVQVYDEEDNLVFETSKEVWNEKRDIFEKRYNLN